MSTTVTRTVRRAEARRCSFCGEPSRPGVEGADAVICARCALEAARLLAPEVGERSSGGHSDDLTLLQLVGACFERNELLDGWLHRYAPFPDDAAASERYRVWRGDLERLLGPPTTAEEGRGQRAEWDGVRLKQAGRGVGLWLRPGAVWRWWHDLAIWRGDPVALVVSWDERGVGRDPWDASVLGELRAAVFARSGRRALDALADGVPGALQLAGAGVLFALADGSAGAGEVAAQVVLALRERAWAGDEVLAEDLEAARTGDASPRRAIGVDLDVLSSYLEGEMGIEGAWIDLRTGEVYSRLDGTSVDERGEDTLEFGFVGSHGGYGDMEAFIATVDDARAAAALSQAIQGRGAFRRFRDVLRDHDVQRDRWHAFSEERRVGRARGWLAGEGFRPLP